MCYHNNSDNGVSSFVAISVVVRLAVCSVWSWWHAWISWHRNMAWIGAGKGVDMCYSKSLADWVRLKDLEAQPQPEDYETLEEWEDAYYCYWDCAHTAELEYGEVCYDTMTDEW